MLDNTIFNIKGKGKIIVNNSKYVEIIQFISWKKKGVDNEQWSTIIKKTKLRVSLNLEYRLYCSLIWIS